MAKTVPGYERFAMLNAAWSAATGLLDDRGNVLGDISSGETRFLRRKCCSGLPENDCAAVFRAALGIAKATIRFRRASCGTRSPKPSSRYELLLSLARSLEAEFPEQDAFLIMAGCRLVEMHWDR